MTREITRLKIRFKGRMFKEELWGVKDNNKIIIYFRDWEKANIFAKLCDLENLIQKEK